MRWNYFYFIQCYLILLILSNLQFHNSFYIIWNVRTWCPSCRSPKWEGRRDPPLLPPAKNRNLHWEIERVRDHDKNIQRNCYFDKSQDSAKLRFRPAMDKRNCRNRNGPPDRSIPGAQISRTYVSSFYLSRRKRIVCYFQYQSFHQYDKLHWQHSRNG